MCPVFKIIAQHSPSHLNPPSDKKEGRPDAKARLSALPEPKLALYTCICIACGVMCFANGTHLAPSKAAALSLLPAFGNLARIHRSFNTCAPQLLTLIVPKPSP